MESQPNQPPQGPHPFANNPNFRPRKDFLVVLGIFIILFGVLLLVGAGFLAAFPSILNNYGAQDLAEEFEGFPIDIISHINRFLIVAGVLYAIYGISLIWLGFGSVLAKRWAVKLLHATGWLVVAMGVLQFIGQLLSIPLMNSFMTTMMEMEDLGGGSGGPGAPSMTSFIAANALSTVIQAVIQLVFTCGPGALLIVVYGRKNVEYTTQYFNPKPSWTDKMSPKLAILWLLYISYISYYVMHLAAVSPLLHEIKLFPNQQLIDISLILGIIILAVITYGVSKAAKWAWWASLAYFIGFTALGYFSIQGLDIREWLVNLIGEETFNTYMESEGIESEKIDRIFDMAIGGFTKYIYLFTGITIAAIIGYLFYIKNEFGKKHDEASQISI